MIVIIQKFWKIIFVKCFISKNKNKKKVYSIQMTSWHNVECFIEAKSKKMSIDLNQNFFSEKMKTNYVYLLLNYTKYR